jgi:serine protease SohB
MDMLEAYALFLAKAATVVVAALVVIGGIGRLVLAGRAKRDGQLRVQRVNDKLAAYERAMGAPFLTRRGRRAAQKERAREEREHRESAARPPSEGGRRRVYLLTFDGDVRASAVDALREEVTAVVMTARSGDEVVVKLESPGGMVHAYGLAAAQLARIREAGVRLTAAVDRIAASGGYMMACVADRIIAAPFAVVGSVGVVAALPNVNRLLKRHDIDVEYHAAGAFKRTLTVIGENTPEGRAKFLEQLQEAHDLFKTHIARWRPGVDLEQIGTGEHWYASQAVQLSLVDGLQTSDDYLLAASKEADVLAVRYERRQAWGSRLASAAESMLGRVLSRSLEATELTHHPL